MINFLETVQKYNDSWNMTFYYIAVLVFLIGVFWTYFQVFIKPLKKKKPLKENIIYNHSEDVIEDYENVYLKKKQKNYKNTSNLK